MITTAAKKDFRRTGIIDRTVPEYLIKPSVRFSRLLDTDRTDGAYVKGLKALQEELSAVACGWACDRYLGRLSHEDYVALKADRDITVPRLVMELERVKACKVLAK